MITLSVLIVFVVAVGGRQLMGRSIRGQSSQRFPRRCLFAVAPHFQSLPKDEKKRRFPFAADELEAATLRAELASDLDWPESGSCPGPYKQEVDEVLLHACWAASSRQNATQFLSTQATHLAASSLASMSCVGGSNTLRELVVPPLSVQIAEKLFTKWESESAGLE